jgi:hypothetical protein
VFQDLRLGFQDLFPEVIHSQKCLRDIVRFAAKFSIRYIQRVFQDLRSGFQDLFPDLMLRQKFLRDIMRLAVYRVFQNLRPVLQFSEVIPSQKYYTGFSIYSEIFHQIKMQGVSELKISIARPDSRGNVEPEVP